MTNSVMQDAMQVAKEAKCKRSQSQLVLSDDMPETHSCLGKQRPTSSNRFKDSLWSALFVVVSRMYGRRPQPRSLPSSSFSGAVVICW